MESCDRWFLCRICLTSKCKILLTDVCSSHPQRNVTFLEAFNTCTQLNALPQDECPQSVCNECAVKLKSFYDFRVKAQTTDMELRLQLLNENQTNNNETPTKPKRSIKSEDYVKDPLEDSGDDSITDDDLKKNFLRNPPDGFENFNKYSEDEEDNKPLVDLLLKSNQIVENVIKTEDDDLEEDDDIKFEYGNNQSENNRSETAQKLILSVEEQIFPKGRLKCKTCGKAYFTLKGLEAHTEVHLANRCAVKRKRKRNTKKNLALSSDSKNKLNNEKISKTVEDDVIKNSEYVENLTENAVSKGLQKNKPQKLKKIFPCNVCGKPTTSASKLRAHMVMHTGEKDYLCTTCPKAFSTIYALKHHIRTHTGERPYECRFCGDRFTRPTTLKSHIRRHTNERPYGCDICGKRFIQHSSMTTHIKMNHMARTIPCPHCDKKYARQTDLNTHLLSHTGDKPFSCQLCSSRFIRLANLNKHMNRHHPGEKLNESHKAKK